MESLNQLFATEIGALAIFLRLSLACVFGGAIGFDREMRDRPAGLRTFIMVSLAACLFTIITLELSYMLEASEDVSTIRPDPLRVVQAITAGVAFIAAGSIIRLDRGKGGARLEGLTTGAGLWLAGAIGLACGAGFFAIAGLVTFFAVIVLVVLKKLEERINL